MGSSQTRVWTCIPCIARWTPTREAQYLFIYHKITSVHYFQPFGNNNVMCWYIYISLPSLHKFFLYLYTCCFQKELSRGRYWFFAKYIELHHLSIQFNAFQQVFILYFNDKINSNPYICVQYYSWQKSCLLFEQPVEWSSTILIGWIRKLRVTRVTFLI